MTQCFSNRSHALSLQDNSQSISDAGKIVWDVIVIGAGPAGSLSARLSALNGLQTLLIEAKRFPRYKVCGGCLNPRALRVLDQAGLTDFAGNTQAVAIRDIRLHAGQQSAAFALSGGLSISRSAMDSVLVESAHAVGAHVLVETSAKIERECSDGFRLVTAQCGLESAQLKTRVVVCADGLSRSSARQLPELSTVPTPNSRIGVGTLFEDDLLPRETQAAYPPGSIVMTVIGGGYIGITRAEHNQVTVAAAFDPVAIKKAGSPEAAIAKGLQSVNLPWLEDSRHVQWYGTPGLTSHAHSVAANRVLVVGDAAGYVEPFTGEGMAAALESAWSAAPLVAEAVHNWDESLVHRWRAIYRSKIRRRQRVCRILSTLSRFPRLVSASLPCFRRFPAAARMLVSSINAE